MLYALGILGVLIHSLFSLYSLVKGKTKKDAKKAIASYNWIAETIMFIMSAGLIIGLVLAGVDETSPFPITEWNIMVYGLSAMTIIEKLVNPNKNKAIITTK